MKIDVCHTVLVLTFILKDPVALGKTVPEMVQFFLPSPLTATCSRGHHQEENFMANFGGITISKHMYKYNYMWQHFGISSKFHHK